MLAKCYLWPRHYKHVGSDCEVLEGKQSVARCNAQGFGTFGTLGAFGAFGALTGGTFGTFGVVGFLTGCSFTTAPLPGESGSALRVSLYQNPEGHRNAPAGEAWKRRTRAVHAPTLRPFRLYDSRTFDVEEHPTGSAGSVWNRE